MLRNNKNCFSEIKENCTKKNKCIIKGMIRRKNLRDLRKLFKYEHIYSMVEK